MKESTANLNHVVIDSLPALSRLQEALRVFRSFENKKPGQYVFRLAALSPEENQRASRLLNEYSKECGCTSGSHFLCIAFTVAVAGYFLKGGTLSMAGLSHLGWLAGIMALVAVLGKGFGLLRARWKAIKYVNQLSDKIYSNP